MSSNNEIKEISLDSVVIGHPSISDLLDARAYLLKMLMEYEFNACKFHPSVYEQLMKELRIDLEEIEEKLRNYSFG
jgi:hypothetical protein